MSKILTADPLTDAEEKRVHAPDEFWRRTFAGKIVLRDFEEASRYRSANHDWRWRNAHDLYIAHVKQKVWEGTRMPRSSLGIFLAFQQIESFIPRAISAIFSNDPWFDMVGQLGTSPEAAEKVRNVVLSQLETCQFREHVRRAIKSALIYGNGVLALEWVHKREDVRRMIPEFVPKKQRIRGIDGRMITVPTGEFKRRLRSRTETMIENRPRVSHISLLDFFIDPNCPTPIPQDARFVVRRVMTSIDELIRFRDEDSWNVPPTPMLLAFAEGKAFSEADMTKLFIETSRSGSWDPRRETTADPGGKRVEVLHYWSHDRHVRIIRTGDSAWTLLNMNNPFGFIPFYSVPYADMLDRFYGLAITDVLEGEQRFQQSLLNARVDELALAIHPPTVRHRGINIPAHQLRQRPGAIIPADDPKAHVVRLFPQGATKEAQIEHAASDIRAQRVTGLTEQALQRPTRSAAESQVRAQASFSRIQYFVENMETTVLECLLRDMHTLNRTYLDPNQLIVALDGAEIDPLEVFGAEVKPKIRAGSRMESRSGLLQVFPAVYQTLANPGLLNQLQQMGKTVDFAEILDILLEATGYKERAELIRDLTPQEQQALAAARQDESGDQLKLRLQRERMGDIEELQGQEFEQKAAMEVIKRMTEQAFSDRDKGDETA